ncbi:hypothetical protein [Sagittula sp.]|uniref:hypothetical protein n=1 Tax=Sagittula sp. TaxID=2038081 RepID=UPI0035161C9F
MVRGEEILQALVAICEGLGLDTELDRSVPVNEKECPRFVVRSGTIGMAPKEGERIETCGRYWTAMPQVEFYQAGGAPAAMRAERVRLWSEFCDAFFASPVLGMLAHGSLPEIECSMVSPSADPQLSGFFIDLGLTFKR